MAAFPRGVFAGPIIGLVCTGLRQGSGREEDTRPARALNVALRCTLLPCLSDVRP